jgi:hypothetical protein
MAETMETLRANSGGLYAPLKAEARTVGGYNQPADRQAEVLAALRAG